VKQERERCLAAIDDIWQPDITMVEITDAIRALNNPPDPDVDNPLTKNPTERDWVEDFGSENGQYLNTCLECGGGFIGHKRRIVCKVCADNRR